MIPKNRTSLPDDASLDQQIRVVEQRMLQQRASSKVHLTLFRSQLRDRMTSPLALLLATGVGFALGPSKGSKPAQSCAEAPARADGVRLLSTMASAVSLAGSVIAMWHRFRADSPPAGRGRPAAQAETKENSPA